MMDVFQWKSGPRRSNGLWILQRLLGLPDFLYDSPPRSHGPMVARASTSQSSRTFISGGTGGIICLTNDDSGTSTSNGYISTLLPLQNDVKSDIAGGDGIPDYDVNANAIIGDELDRTSDLGFIQGGRGIVFFHVAYGGNTATRWERLDGEQRLHRAFRRGHATHARDAVLRRASSTPTATRTGSRRDGNHHVRRRLRVARTVRRKLQLDGSRRRPGPSQLRHLRQRHHSQSPGDEHGGHRRRIHAARGGAPRKQLGHGSRGQPRFPRVPAPGAPSTRTTTTPSSWCSTSTERP